MSVALATILVAILSPEYRSGELRECSLDIQVDSFGSHVRYC